ncbi:MAG: hypothetical protein RL391_528 [Actinomycetota bacterium]|jgi:choline monooxygenase
MVETLPASWYSDPAVYSHERSAIWAHRWIMFCTTAELQKPGDYVADEIAGWPLIAIVTPEGELRAFHNVCPHRAGVILWPGSGRSGNLVCRYHGWAFGWDGALKSARDFGATEPPCIEDNSLKAVRVETWGPLVFVCLDPEASPLSDEIGLLDEHVRRHDFDGFHYGHRVTRELACNWKTYVDNYLEGYHVQLLHPLLNSAIDMSTYRVSIPDPTFCLHEAGPVEGSTSAGVWVFKYPNLAVNVYSDGMNIERIVPLSKDRTAVVYDYFAYDLSPERMEQMVEMSNVTLDEDQMIAELVQRNLDAGVYRKGLLSPKHETGLAWFQDRIRKELAL